MSLGSRVERGVGRTLALESGGGLEVGTSPGEEGEERKGKQN